jgi:large subunit ribosomal protein L9
MSYQLLLLEDVDELGRSGDVVKVKPGYARNFLLPTKKALVADARTLQLQAKLREEREKRAVVDRAEADLLSAKIAEIVVKISVKVDQEGNLYGSVAATDIVKATQEHGVVLEKRQVVLPHPIKSLGLHSVPLKLKEGVRAVVHVEVVAENQLNK